LSLSRISIPFFTPSSSSSTERSLNIPLILKDEGSCISCEVLGMVKFERAEDSRIGIEAFLYLSFDDKASLDIEELCRIALSVEVLHGEPSSSLVESRKEGNDGDGVGVREGERF